MPRVFREAARTEVNCQNTVDKMNRVDLADSLRLLKKISDETEFLLELEQDWGTLLSLAKENGLTKVNEDVTQNSEKRGRKTQRAGMHSCRLRCVQQCEAAMPENKTSVPQANPRE